MTFGSAKFIIKCEGGTQTPTHYFFREAAEIYKLMTYEQRKRLAAMRADGIPMAEISRVIGVHLATAYRELKRGGAETVKDIYNPDVGEKVYREHLKMRHRPKHRY